MTKPTSPFRYFNSSPEVIRLVVMINVRFQQRPRFNRQPLQTKSATSSAAKIYDDPRAAALAGWRAVET